MALNKRRAKMALTGFFVIGGFTGCCADGPMVRQDTISKDALVRADTPSENGRAFVARSQAPEILPPVQLGKPGRAVVSDQVPPVVSPIAPGRATAGDPIDTGKAFVAPVSPASGISTLQGPTSNNIKNASAVNLPNANGEEGDTQVRIVASIGNTPIYESEVREAVYQRLGEILKLSTKEQAAKQKELFKEELRRIIERELVLEDMNSTLTSRKQTNALGKLKEAASKQADKSISEIKKERGMKSDEELKAMLRAQGLTLAGVRRQIERGMMMRIYLQEKISSRTDSISLVDIREYYDSHPKDFLAEDSVQWMDMFVMKNKFENVADAKKYAEQLLTQLKDGADFGTLAAKSGHGDSALRNGAGIGEKPGEIFPPDIEPAVLKLRSGQLAIEETDNGFHIIKIIERVVAGRRPLDDRLQNEVKQKVQAQIYEREAKRYVDTLWKRSQPQVWIDL